MTEVGVRDLRNNLSRYLEALSSTARSSWSRTEVARVARVLPVSGERTIDP